jgi:hypothetical protein
MHTTITTPHTAGTHAILACTRFVGNNADARFLPQIVDPKKASYGVENPLFAVTQLAQTTMRSDIGKISLDKTFAERDTLNKNIVEAIRCLLPFDCCMHVSFAMHHTLLQRPRQHNAPCLLQGSYIRLGYRVHAI